MNRATAVTLATLFLLVALVPERSAAQMNVSLNGGLAYATLEGDDVGDEWGTSRGFMFGAQVGFPVNDMFSISPGLWWVQKGAEGEFPGFDVTLEPTYLEVPILGQFRVTSPDRPLGVHVFLGPSIGFEIGCEVENETAGTSSDCEDNPTQDEREKTDFGLIFGGGVSLPVGSSVAAILNAGLDMGLRSLGEEPVTDVKNSVWFVTLGLGFPLGL